MRSKEETAAMMGISDIFGFAPRKGLALLECLGSAAEAFRMSERDASALLGADFETRKKLRPERLDGYMASVEKLTAEGVRCICLGDEDYPPLLAECPDPPIGLYLKGGEACRTLLRSRINIAIVGTRDPDLYGLSCCQELVRTLSDSPLKPGIISGLALGIDYSAHATAVDCGLASLGVMATGIDRIYPARHAHLADRMCSGGGGVITDYSPGTLPMAWHFLRRNRIIAGMCQATILIQSRIKGGGMTTARLAASYDRDVYAFPGRIRDLRNAGCNALIARRVAEIAESPESLAVKLGLSVRARDRDVRHSLADIAVERLGGMLDTELMDDLRAVAEAIEKEDGISTERLCSICTLPYKRVAAAVTAMESEGLVRTDLLGRCCRI